MQPLNSSYLFDNYVIFYIGIIIASDLADFFNFPDGGIQPNA